MNVDWCLTCNKQTSVSSSSHSSLVPSDLLKLVDSPARQAILLEGLQKGRRREHRRHAGGD